MERLATPQALTKSSHSGTVKEDDEGESVYAIVYNWVTAPMGYVSGLIYPRTPSPSTTNTNKEESSSRDPIDSPSGGRINDGLEGQQQFLMMASSAGLGLFGGGIEIACSTSGSSPSIPDYSLHGVYVPSGIDDWNIFAAGLPDAAYPRYRMVLPKKSKILALDLDETLVHSTSKSSSDCDYFVEVLVDRSSCLYYVFKRPAVDRFLDTVSSWYHLVIYTASLREYAEPVVSWLDKGRGLFKKRLFRTACMEQIGGVFVKNLTLVDTDLSRVCLIDNSPASFLMHPDNGILVESWTTQNKTDNCLLDLLPFLDALRFADDVRSILSLRRLQPAPLPV